MIMKSLQPRFARHLMGLEGKKPAIGQRPGDVSAISTVRPRPPRYYQTVGQTSGVYYPPSPHVQYRSPVPFRPMSPTYLHSAPQPVYATQTTQRPPAHYPQPRAPPAPRPMRQFSQLGMPLSRAFQKLMEGGLLTALAPRPPPQPLPPQFRMDLHCAYHQGPGHDTDRCSALRHAIQDLIDQGLVNLGQPSVTTNPLPAHTTHSVPPPTGDDGYEIVGATSDSSIPAPFSLIPDRAPLQLIPFTPSLGIAQAAPPVTRPFGGTDSREEVRREDDEILRQLQSTQARISIWSLLATSSIHRDALIRALSQIRVETSTTPEGLIHMMTADRATCIVFSADDLPPEGSDHTRPLYITVVCSGHRVPSVLLDNGSALNVCPLATAIALGFAPSDFGPSTQTVLRIPASFNLLLGRPWIHQAGAIPSSLHQKVKFIHDGQVITVQSTRDMISSSEPVLQISHSDDDFFLTGFTFDEYLVLDMMRGMSFLPGFGLGRRQHGSSEFVTSIDHETPYGLGFTPSEDDVCYMARLRRDRGSEVQPRVEEIGVDDSTLGELQHVFHQMQLGDETPDMSASAMILPPSPIEPAYSPCASRMRLLIMVQREPFSPLELFGVSVIEIAEEDQTVPAPELSAFVIPTVDMYEGTVGPIEGASDSVDPPLSFDILSGFVTRFDCVSDDSIFDINDEIAQPDSDDQPRELKIGLPLSTDERNRLIHLLRSYLDVFAWSYEDMPGLDPSIVQHHLPICHMPDQPFDVVLHGWVFRGYAIWVEECRSHLSASATALFHDMMHRDVEVYVDDMIVKSRGRADHLAALERFFERIRKFRLRLNPKKCTFGVTSGKLLGHMVSERGIEVDPDKIKAILDMPVPRTEKEIRGFLGRLQYISRFIARLTDICEPIFRLLRKNQPTVWNDDCQLAFERIKEYLLSPPVLVPPMPGRPLLLYLSVSDMALGCMLAQLDDSGKERAIYYLSKRMLEYEMRYVMIERFCLALVWATRRLRHYMTEYSVHLISRLDPLRYLFDRPALAASLPIIESRPIDDDFPDEEFVAMTRLSGWRMYFDGAANHSGYGIGVLLVSPQGDHIPRSVRLTFPDYHPTTNNIVEFRVTGRPETKLKPYHAYLELLIEKFEELKYIHLPRAHNQFADALATLASTVDIPTNVVVRPLLIETRSAPAYCHLIDETEVQDDLPWFHDIRQFLRFGTYPEAATAKDRRALRQLATRFVICGETYTDDQLMDITIMFGSSLCRSSDERDCCQFVQRCPECQMHGDLIHVPPSELHALTSPWPFSVWGIDIIGKISPKSSNGHEFILVAIDYFTKWVEAASYAKLTSLELQFHQKYGIQHHRSSAYRPQTNGAVEAANKNIKRILRKMVETSRDWSESFLLPYGHITEMGSLRVALSSRFETEWAQARFDQLNLLDERRLRAADHVQAYQRKWLVPSEKGQA
ncbi:Retrovirus-related Pol polyprotein from transposon 17.6 [Vitis vinifera]|uniref:Retrovirus-related Pol polyprotein from transposon 17.6 n=1 Tax=Vitis vinifera TaxID=29760 RepID=A0A438I4W8_VITVI|nr:Retrovirus-related Pol polyprotein from transposon 17.6 [Vitis vinifera]